MDSSFCWFSPIAGSFGRVFHWIQSAEDCVVRRGLESTIFDQIDRCRRVQGQFFELMALPHSETPARIVFSSPPVTLKHYEGSVTGDPVLLIVPAPIKRAYIWDLSPSASVVRECLRNSVNVYLIQWEDPYSSESQDAGLAQYADEYMLACMDAIAREVNHRRIFLAAHSLGGTLAAIFSALHPKAVRGLILLGAPLQFGTESGAFAPLVAFAPRAHVITALLPRVAGSFLNQVSVLASPCSFIWERWVDFMQSISDPEALLTHLRVLRWTMDEMALPKRLFEEIVELLYRENRFVGGSLKINGRIASPEKISAPVLSIVESRSRVVPPSSVLPFHAAVGSTDTRVLRYEGDVGVALQHVGMLVGKRAHRKLWPKILHWLRAHHSSSNSLEGADERGASCIHSVD